MTRTSEENRTRQVIVGVGILLLIAIGVCGAMIGSRYLPGLLGEWIGAMMGVLTTPFFMEASFVVLGLTIVIGLNAWRRNRDGEELVFLERVDETEAGAKLPEHASWALYREKPLDGETPSLQARAEGAVAIGDYDFAAELISMMPEKDLKRAETLQLRLDLAKATGKVDLARQLEAELKTHPVEGK